MACSENNNLLRNNKNTIASNLLYVYFFEQHDNYYAKGLSI